MFQNDYEGSQTEHKIAHNKIECSLYHINTDVFHIVASVCLEVTIGLIP